jgi:hypothetical protein
MNSEASTDADVRRHMVDTWLASASKGNKMSIDSDQSQQMIIDEMRAARVAYDHRMKSLNALLKDKRYFTTPAPTIILDDLVGKKSKRKAV